MTDIVDRLRGGITDGTQLRWMVTPIHQEAADEITRLRAAVADAYRKGQEDMRGVMFDTVFEVWEKTDPYDGLSYSSIHDALAALPIKDYSND